MALLTLGALIAVLWAVSLCKVFHLSRSQSKGVAFSNGSEISQKRRNILLVIAHPDDESMFFSPTLLFLASEGHNVHILCISTGNADGKGQLRRQELYRACVILKVPLQNIKLLDRPNLQDGFDNQWNHKLLSTIICEEIKTWDIDMIITFDDHGVSGHRNHHDVHHGVRQFLSKNSEREVEAWELISTSIFRKYSGPVDIWLSYFFTLCYSRGESCCLVNGHPRKCFLAMAEHYSQWVWFRKLFVIFSSYTYVNTLKRINM